MTDKSYNITPIGNAHAKVDNLIDKLFSDKYLDEQQYNAAKLKLDQLFDILWKIDATPPDDTAPVAAVEAQTFKPKFRWIPDHPDGRNWYPVLDNEQNVIGTTGDATSAGSE